MIRSVFGRLIFLGGGVDLALNHQYLDPVWYHLWRLVSEKCVGDKSATLENVQGFSGINL